MKQLTASSLKYMVDAVGEFLACLRTAGTGISAQYIRIPRADGSYLTDERTYCYELYHRLRACLGDKFRFTLMGELGKAAPWLLQRARPDVLVHTPRLAGEA